jgi:hypothetical protein
MRTKDFKREFDRGCAFRQSLLKYSGDYVEQGRGVVPMDFSNLLVTVEDQPALIDDIRA